MGSRSWLSSSVYTARHEQQHLANHNSVHSMPDPNADADRYEVLKKAVADIGLIRRGSVVRRFMPCGKSGCRCQATPPVLHGPYYQWTRKIRGTTQTVRVSQSDAKLIKRWIDNRRRLEQLVADMDRIADRITARLLRDSSN
jgi:hypothetical protein